MCRLDVVTKKKASPFECLAGRRVRRRRRYSLCVANHGTKILDQMQLVTASQPWKCSFHILTTQDPFPGSFWRSVCGSNYEMTRVVMGSEGETCLSIFD